ncbi:hypothetical protein EJ08DRAFT_467414 [Tothia fuscella]|uniref:Uncharacterized protein n=1 Tax=Tothia fuscella TaxID=1048955 RepID=A0A9P4NXY4_9PEZI|nr:hypothetical protein EJ08DRAFT_467414 [Tothia fuscella]
MYVAIQYPDTMVTTFQPLIIPLSRIFHFIVFPIFISSKKLYHRIPKFRSWSNQISHLEVKSLIRLQQRPHKPLKYYLHLHISNTHTHTYLDKSPKVICVTALPTFHQTHTFV